MLNNPTQKYCYNTLLTIEQLLKDNKVDVFNSSQTVSIDQSQSKYYIGFKGTFDDAIRAVNICQAYNIKIQGLQQNWTFDQYNVMLNPPRWKLTLDIKSF